MTDVGVAATRNRTMWLVRTCVIGAVGGLICCFLNELLLGFLAPDAYGFFTVIVAGVAAGIVVVLVGIAAYVADAARGRLGMSRKASRWTAAAVCVVGWLPWFAPDEARMSLSAGLAFGPGLILGTAWFVALAALAVGARRFRLIASALLVTIIVLWLPVRNAVVGSATDAALRGRAIPRSMALTASWDGFLPGEYQRVGGEVRLQYDFAVPMPCPDCESTGVLSVTPATDDPCGLPMAFPDGGIGRVVGCNQVDARTWARLGVDFGCDVVQNRGNLTIRIYEDDCPPVANLLEILASVRPADSAEILDRT